MTTRTAFGTLRLAVAVVCVVALVARFFWGLGSATFTAGNFFAYLTIQSNIAFVVVSAIAGILTLRGERDPAWLDTLRATVLTCTVTAGAVFAVLIQQSVERGFPLSVPWSDQVLHFWLPAVALLDWVLAPGRGRAQWRTIAYTVGFPVVWGLITLYRGAQVGWYPYFFLDPAQVSSFGELALLCGIALAFFAAIATGVVAISRTAPVFGRARE